MLVSVGSHMLFLAEEEPVSGKTGLSGCSLSGNVHGKAHPGTGVSVLSGTGQVAVPVALLWATEPAPVLPPLAGAEPKFLALSLKKKVSVPYQFLISSEKIPGRLFIPGRSLATPDR